jgi:hypothetical protein
VTVPVELTVLAAAEAVATTQLVEVKADVAALVL